MLWLSISTSLLIMNTAGVCAVSAAALRIHAITAHSAALLLAAAGFLVAVVVPTAIGIAAGTILIGAGIAISAPSGFAGLAACAPPRCLGQTMGAGEAGRELGDAGGPIIVGALSPIGLGAGLLALAAAIGSARSPASGLAGPPAENPSTAKRPRRRSADAAAAVGCRPS